MVHAQMQFCNSRSTILEIKVKGNMENFCRPKVNKKYWMDSTDETKDCKCLKSNMAWLILYNLIDGNKVVPLMKMRRSFVTIN